MISGTISAGSMSGSATVTTSDDGILEMTESFTVTIVEGPSGMYSITGGTTDTLTVSIMDATGKYDHIIVHESRNDEG